MKEILIIDDDQDFADAMTAVLKAADYNVSHAENGEIGFEKAQQSKPDLILLDVMMTSNTEGLEVARKLHGAEATKDIPIIMVTSIRSELNVSFDLEPDEEWLPVKVFLEKPVRPEILLKVVAENI